MDGINITFNFATMDAAIAFLQDAPGAVTTTATTGAVTTTATTGAVTTTATTGAPEDGVELDSEGFPWDNRIHSATKTKKDDGTWRGKRGATAELIAAVKAETTNAHFDTPQQTQQPVQQMPVQQTQQPVQQMPVQQTQQPVQQMPVQQTQQPVQQMPVQQTQQPVQQMPVQQTQQPVQQMPVQQTQQPVQQMPVQQTQQPVQGEDPFNSFMVKLTPLMNSGTVVANDLVTLTNELATTFNVQLSAITDISGNVDMINYAINWFSNQGKWS